MERRQFKGCEGEWEEGGSSRWWRGEVKLYEAGYDDEPSTGAMTKTGGRTGHSWSISDPGPSLSTGPWHAVSRLCQKSAHGRAPSLSPNFDVRVAYRADGARCSALIHGPRSTGILVHSSAAHTSAAGREAVALLHTGRSPFTNTVTHLCNPPRDLHTTPLSTLSAWGGGRGPFDAHSAADFEAPKTTACVVMRLNLAWRESDPSDCGSPYAVQMGTADETQSLRYSIISSAHQHRSEVPPQQISHPSSAKDRLRSGGKNIVHAAWCSDQDGLPSVPPNGQRLLWLDATQPFFVTRELWPLTRQLLSPAQRWTPLCVCGSPRPKQKAGRLNLDRCRLAPLSLHAMDRKKFERRVLNTPAAVEPDRQLVGTQQKGLRLPPLHTSQPA
ncbi:hypothetical protein K469DRAFT_696888 [Zopfia rhizophila CBS 207.26]|uniref:Uncharacterized protein n=1 Tax=Zopfia rhizophila CBS 207.26 TaxID=1314779 RepID=A0A6A6EMK0_9PEZI|nr:hypothetical protein K469DRAFT_696888 [Zopfia rhizophila CBS 207.26]